MSHEEITSAQLRKYLSAFADGELDVESNLEVLQHLTMNTQATRRVMHIEQLRQNLQKHVEQTTPQMPDSLKENILAQLDQSELSSTSGATSTGNSASTDRPLSVNPQATTSPWMTPIRILSGMAAVLVITTMLAFSGLFDQRETNYVRITERQNPSEVLLASMNKAQSMTRMHSSCSDNLNMLGKGGKVFTGEVQQVLPQLASYMGVNELPDFNLEKFSDYKFTKAGECHSGKNAIHMVFQKDNEVSGTKSSMSLWIMPLQADQNIKDKSHYIQSSDQQEVHFGRVNDFIFFLISDDQQVAEKSARELIV